VPVVHASTDLRQGDLEDVLMTIRDDGFDPSEITRVPGKFLLSVDDRRNDKTQRLTLRLSREGGEHLRDIEVPEKATDWAEEVELQAGRYVLTEVSHSNWTCRITVQ
jgi:hypothetical protein